MLKHECTEAKMIKNFLLGQSDVPMLSKALDVYLLRQKAIASNIANINTVGYRRKEVRFEDKLQAQMKTRLEGRETDKRHIPLGRLKVREVTPEITEDPSEVLESDVNNVDIDREIVEQVKNELRFMYVSRMASGSFNSLRASIKGRYDR